MRLARLHFLGMGYPAWLMPDITAQENGKAGRLYFRVRASVPFIGFWTEAPRPKKKPPRGGCIKSLKGRRWET